MLAEERSYDYHLLRALGPLGWNNLENVHVVGMNFLSLEHGADQRVYLSQSMTETKPNAGRKYIVRSFDFMFPCLVGGKCNPPYTVRAPS